MAEEPAFEDSAGTRFWCHLDAGVEGTLTTEDFGGPVTEECQIGGTDAGFELLEMRGILRGCNWLPLPRGGPEVGLSLRKGHSQEILLPGLFLEAH